MEDQPKKPEEWSQKVDELFKSGEDWTTKRQITINWNYYVGNQWIGWDRFARRVVEAPRDNNEERVTHNIIKPRVMTKLAKQTKNRIKYDVIPDTNSQERIEIAKAASKFIKFWWQEEEMDRKTRDIFLNNAVKGYCAVKVYFDPDEGDDITPDEDTVERLGLQMDKGKTVHIGKIVCRIVDPLCLAIDPEATYDEEIRWMVEEKPRDIDYIKEKYGKEVTAEDNVTYMSQYNNNSLSMDNNSQKKNKNMAMIRELWMKPCSKYPKGLKVTCTKSELLDISEDAGELPYFIFGDIPIPGTVKYDAFIKDMLPIQREINIIRTMFATHAKRMGNSYWGIPLGSDVDEEQLTNEEGAVIYYTQGMEPKRIPSPDIPSFYDRILEYGKQDIDDMSGAREISQGRLPAGLDTASGLSLMVEQENEKLAVSSQNYEQGMKKLLQRVLKLMKKHYTEERLGRILGEDNEIELISFTGADLSGGEDINIVQGSSLPEMRSAQEERIITLWREHAIVRKDGTPDTETFLRMMGLGDSTELFEQHQLDENKAKMENKTFSKAAEDPNILQAVQQYQQQLNVYKMAGQITSQQGGTPEDAGFKKPQPIPGMPIVRDFYDHDIHIYNHNVFRKSSEYDELPPEIQQMVDAHVQEHMDALQAPIIAQQQQQMQMQQAQMAQQSQEAETNHQRQMEMKQADHSMNMQREQMKGDMALQQAAMRGGRT